TTRYRRWTPRPSARCFAPSGLRCGGARCWSRPSGCRRWCSRTGRWCCGTASSSSKARRRSWLRWVGASRRYSETRRVRHSHRSGLSRLTTYLQGRRLAVFVLVLVATGQAVCQTGGWLLVRAAIDNGIGDSNSEYLTVVVVIYILV